MQTASRRISLLAVLATLAPASWMSATLPAAAFQVGQSSNYAGCAIWLNDQGQPLRNKTGREIGRKVPCAGETHRRDTYEVLPGEAKGTLVIHDASHQVECILVLEPGSSTVVVPKVCQAWHD